MLLLEIEPPFDKRDIQLARRRLAKVWHPDIAPPGRQLEHERHLKAINEAADQLEQLAEESRGGRVTRNAVKVGAAAARKRRAEEGRRAYEEEQRARADAADRAKHDPFGSRVPDHSVVHRYALPVVPGVGRRQRERHLLHRRRRRHPAVGARELPPRRAHRAGGFAPVRRLLQARPRRRARAAVHDRRQARPRRGRLPARRPPAGLRARRRAAQHRGPAADDARVLAGRRLLGGGARGARLDPRGATARRPTATRPASTRTWGRSRRRSTPLPRRSTATRPTPRPGSGSGGYACAPSTAPARARRSSARASWAAAEQGLLDLALVANLMGDVGAEVTACEQATALAPESPDAWARYAHALARTDRISDCLAACERALELWRPTPRCSPCVATIASRVLSGRSARSAHGAPHGTRIGLRPPVPRARGRA